MDTISVVIPAYNCGPWLGRCLDSLLAQSWKELELVVVDDGSTDDTPRILRDYAGAYPNIRPVFQSNAGVTAARLTGVAAATGDWIGFTDADDQVEPDMYARLMELAQEKQADISHCGHQVRFADGRISYVHNSGTRWVRDCRAGLADLLDGGQIDSSLCTKLFRRSLFAGLEDWMTPGIKNGEDLLMNYYLFSRAERSVYEDRCPYHYILREGSASHHQYNDHSLFDPIRVRQQIVACCEEDLKDEARRALLRYSLYTCALTATHRGKDPEGFEGRARALVKEQKPYYSLTSRRNQILAYLICYAPWLFRLAYRTYVKLFRREEQH